jgi:CHAD domain-containing protein
MRKYAQERASTLLRRLAFQMNRSVRLRDAESIHDLRVSIRRFEQCLRIFRQFFTDRDQRKIRRRLRKIMNLAGEIRNRDIALALLKKAGVPQGSALSTKMRLERKRAQSELLDFLDGYRKRKLSRKWRVRLGL